MEKTIDARGLMCPKPVIMTKQELRGMDEGTLTVLVDNNTAVSNLCALAATEGLVAQTEPRGADFAVTLHKMAVAASDTTPAPAAAAILITGDQFGTGDPEFGKTLLKNFIFALAEAETKPAAMLFLNTGAFFTCEGSAVLESLESLAEAGVEILTCGACLDFYNLKEKLAVGGVTNMYVIAEKLLGAGNVIRI